MFDARLRGAAPLGYVLLVLALIAGCTKWSDTRGIVIGPYGDRPNEQLFNTALEAVRAQGYVPTEVDASRGRFTVPANASVTGRRRTLSATFTIQCYREGWVRIVPAGTAVKTESDGYEVVADVKKELDTIALRLRESLEGGAHVVN